MSKPITQQDIDNFKDSLLDIIEIPNSWLPESFQNHRDGGRSLRELEQMCEQQEQTLTPHKQKKQIKARNVDKYREQFANSGKIEWDGEADELQLYKNQQAIIGGMVSAGLIEPDELLEDI